eukprot:m.310794 g.310794  ORF g.310794 m.310794 type:complete len:448 (+) comp54975_c0_seq1:88-1431(+)
MSVSTLALGEAEGIQVRHQDLLRERLACLMHNEDTADVVFLVGECKQEYPCHRVILGAQSKVFEVMLFGQMKEAKMRRIPLPNITPRVFDLMRRYLYTGCVDLTADDLFPLMSAADQYDMLALKRDCGKKAHEYISVENVATALRESSMMREEWLAAECLKFIDQNASDVVSSDAFLELTEEDVVSIVQRDTIVLEEIDVFNAVLRWGEAVQSQFRNEFGAKEVPTLKDVLKSVLCHVRLAQISPGDLLRVVKPSDVFPLETLFQVMAYHAAPAEVDHHGIVYEPRRKPFVVIDAFRHGGTYGAGVRQFTYTSPKLSLPLVGRSGNPIVYVGKCEDNAGCQYTLTDLPAGVYYVWVYCIDLPHNFNCRSYGSWDNHAVTWSAESDGSAFATPTWLRSRPHKLTAGTHTWKFGAKPDGGYFTIGWAQLIFTTNPNFEPEGRLYERSSS